jgi:hypothetical protein
MENRSNWLDFRAIRVDGDRSATGVNPVSEPPGRPQRLNARLGEWSRMRQVKHRPANLFRDPSFNLDSYVR